MNIAELYQLYLKHPVICTDTRKINLGCIFFALKGDNFNGNTFASQALKEGASFVIIDERDYKTGDQYILVDDVLETLQELAKFHRRQSTIPVIGITGTNGKTTTKELIHSVLSQHYRCYATKGNLNNHIGVPLTILSITNDIEIAIIEMGANHQKEIEFLCSIAQPTHGLITNIGKAHLEGFGGIEGVKKGKGELYDYLASHNGIAFINQSNPLLISMSREHNLQRIVYYGTGHDNLISGKLMESTNYLMVEWQNERMESASQTGTYSDKPHIALSHLTGVYNLENILAAICIGSFFKLSPDEINQGISDYIPANNRSQITKTEKNIVICDYYNANPSSVLVSLDNLAKIEAENRVLILGDMFELGKDSITEHLAILQRAEQINLNKRIFIGTEFYKLKNTVDDFFSTTQEAYDALKSNPILNSTILIKGSRGMKLEQLLELL